MLWQTHQYSDDAITNRILKAIENGKGLEACNNDPDPDAKTTVKRPALVAELKGFLRPQKVDKYGIVLGPHGSGESTAIREALRSSGPQGAVKKKKKKRKRDLIDFSASDMSLEDQYLSDPALSYLAGEVEAKDKAVDVVSEEFQKDISHQTISLDQLFVYDVPEDLGEGVCTKVKAKDPFDLGAELFGTPDWKGKAVGHPITKTIQRLKNVVDRIANETSVHWIGIYKLVEPKEGDPYLLKLAYAGNYSRAKFPLTESFKKTSNNSWVGMEGKAKLIQDLESYQGPYYICDGLVNSELCVPIFNSEKKVIGIIDAESYQRNFFTPINVFYVLKACHQLGLRNFGF